MNNLTPLARSEDIVVQDLPNETLICDLITNKVFCLNETASQVWKLCDGKNKPADISRKLSKIFDANITDDLVWVTLNKLANLELLSEKIDVHPYSNFETRRSAIKRIGLTSMIALPLVSVIIAPTSATAQSGLSCPSGTPNPAGCPCAAPTDCSSGCCLENFPNSPICGAVFGQQGCFCTDNSFCDTNNFECCAPANPVCNPGC